MTTSYHLSHTLAKTIDEVANPVDARLNNFSGTLCQALDKVAYSAMTTSYHLSHTLAETINEVAYAS